MLSNDVIAMNMINGKIVVARDKETTQYIFWRCPCTQYVMFSYSRIQPRLSKLRSHGKRAGQSTNIGHDIDVRMRSFAMFV